MYCLYVGVDYTHIDINALAQGIKSFLASHVRDSVEKIRLFMFHWMVCYGRKVMFYLTMHSTHFMFGYMASDIVKNHSDSERTISVATWATLSDFICTIPQTGYHIPWPLLHQSWSTGWNEK